MATLAVLLVALAFAPAAQADVVDGGSARLKLTAGLAKALKREGVRLIGLGTAKAGKAGVTLPIREGLLENRHGSGYLFFEGGFRLRAGKRTVAVKRLVLNMNEGALRARVNGRAMKVAEPSPQQASLAGFDLALALKSLKLTPRAAAVFNRKLGLDGVFKAGRSLGSVAAVAEFEFLSIRGGELTLAIDEAFREKLQSLEVEVTASHPATLLSASPPAVSIRIEGGQISPDLSLGVLLGEGGLNFVRHDETFDHYVSFLTTNVALDSRLVSGAANVQPNPQQLQFSGSIGTFPAPGAAAQADPNSGEIGASSLPLALGPDLARAMNETFGAPKGKPDFFSPGESSATLSFRVRTR